MQVDLTPVHDCVAAIDVHLNKLVVCIIKVEPGAPPGDPPQVTQRVFGGFKRDRAEMAQWIAQAQPRCVVMESTGIYWRSPYAALEKLGIRAKVVNAQHVAKIAGRKTDMSDALWLAILARAGLLSGSFIAHPDIRHLRLISRYHSRLTAVLGAEKNRLLKVLADGGVRLSAVVSDPHGKACREMVGLILDGVLPEQAVRFAGRLKAPREELQASLEHELTDIHRYVAQSMREHIEQIEKRLDDLQAQLLKQLQPWDGMVQLLLTVPGMDHLGIAKLLAEVGVEMSLFGSPGRLAAWCGLCPGNNESAGKRKYSRTRIGNPYARSVLVEMANAAAKTQCWLQAKFRSLVPRKGHKKSIVAIAHKLIRLTYFMLTRQEPYRDRGEDFEALRTKRNAPCWIKQLAKYGHLPVPA